MLLMGKRRLIIFLTLAAIAVFVILSVAAAMYFALCPCGGPPNRPYTSVRTIAGTKGEFGEPFGVAVKDGDVYVSDGEAGKIWLIKADSPPVEFAQGLETPSAIAFDKNGDLVGQ